MSDIPMPAKPVIFRFEGGPVDGTVSSTAHTAPDIMMRPDILWGMTKGGKIGAGMQGLFTNHQVDQLQIAMKVGNHQLMPHSHEYRVVSRDETDDQVLIVMRHVPEKTKAARKDNPPSL